MMLRFIPVLLCFLPQDKPKEAQPKPSLPPVRRITLKLDSVPAREAMKAFSEQASMPVFIEPSKWMSDSEDNAELKTPITLALKETPLVEAAVRFGEVWGVRFTFHEGHIFVPPMYSLTPLLARSYHEHFGFFVCGLWQFVETDFAEERRECLVEVSFCAQPDVAVFDSGRVELAEAVDDLGHDLRVPQPKPPDRRPQSDMFEVRLALPPREARSISRLRGTLELFVPGETVEVAIQDLRAAKIGPIDAGDYIVEESCRGREYWQFKVEPKRGAPLAGLAELRVKREGNPVVSSRLQGFVEGRDVWLKDDPSAVAQNLSFKIVRNRACIQVPFDFKDIDLGRKKK